jgi:hypothetical protein
MKELLCTYIDKYQAAKLTGLSVDTLKGYRLQGLLQEGIHYVRVNSRVIRYNAQLLQDWLTNRYDSVAHQRAIEIYQASLLSNKKKTVR